MTAEQEAASFDANRARNADFWLWVRLVIGISSTAVAAYGITLMFGLSAPPFVGVGTENGFRVQPFAGMPLPNGMQTGDEIDLPGTPVESRSIIVLTDTPPPGTVLSVMMRRGELRFPVSFSYVAFRDAPGNTLLWLFTSASCFYFLEWLLGVLILWRGRDWAAWGLGVQALAESIGAAVRYWPTHSVGEAWAVTVASDVLQPSAMWAGLYVMADALVGPGLSHVWRRLFRYFCVAVLAVRGAVVLIDDQGVIQLWWSPVHTEPLLQLLWAARVGALIVLLVAGLRLAPAGSRLRLKWITASLALMQLPNLISYLLPQFNGSLGWNFASILIVLLAVSGLLYSTLRHRLIDIRLVLNRALVYALMTSFVVGIFALLENLLEQRALGSQASMLLQLGVPLIMGIAINGLHKRFEGLIERLVFRSAHRAEQGLTAFARRCAFIETEDALIAQTVTEVQRHSGALAVAVYDRGLDGNAPGAGVAYHRLGAAAEPAPSSTISSDEPAFVALRADLAPIDLAAFPGALGKDGLLLPMHRGRQLFGALFCGPREAEGYSADERRLLARVAQEVGVALRDLRAAESERLVAALADGRLDPARARLQAQSVLLHHPA